MTNTQAALAILNDLSTTPQEREIAIWLIKGIETQQDQDQIIVDQYRNA